MFDLSNAKRYGGALACIIAVSLLASCGPPPTEGKPKATVDDAVEVETEPGPGETPAPAGEATGDEASTDAETASAEPTESAEGQTDVTEEAAEAQQAVADAANAVEYEFTKNCYIGFAGSKPLGTHYGQFPQYEGTVSVVGDDLTTAKINVTLDMTALTVDNSVLTGVLKGENFFEVEENPEATFVSTAVKEAEEGYSVSGNLKLRGTAKSVTFPADITLEGDTLTAMAEFSVDRHAWGIGEGYTGETVIHDDVLITLDIEATAVSETEE